MSSDLSQAKIVREFEPLNLEFPFSTLGTSITANDAFYVRNHFPEPVIDSNAWRLSVEGCVAKPFQLTYDQLVSLPSQNVTSILECAGNSRVFLVPKVTGAQWGQGAIGNAEWTGVPLNVILQRAGVAANAVEVVFEGEDKGVPDATPKPREPIHYSRSIPLSKAMQGDALLAYQMNGQPLSQSHGFPVRLIVPGWYGMASVKWLKRVVVIDSSFDGYFQKIDYAFWEDRDGLAVRTPITEIELKSQIARPAPYEVLPAASSYTVSGAAWSGESKVQAVDISTDGGETWQPTILQPRDGAHGWSLWSYEWSIPNEPQSCTLMCRATDETGKQQPLTRDPRRDTYRITHVLPIPVQVR